MSVYESAVDSLQRRNQKNITGQFDMFSSLSDGDKEDNGSAILKIDYPDIPEFSDNELLSMEKDVAGIYMSGHPLRKYEAFAKSINADEICDINAAAESGNFEKYRDGTPVTLVGTVTSKREKITKSDKRMAFLQFEDTGGILEVIAFANVYNRYAPNLYEGAAVGITGEVSVKESRDGDKDGRNEISILLKSVFALKETAQTADNANTADNTENTSGTKKVKMNLSSLLHNNTQSAPHAPYNQNPPVPENLPQMPVRGRDEKLCLYLKVPSETSREFERVKSVLEIYSYGTSEVFVYFDDTKKLTHAVGLDVNITPTMLKMLSLILTDECVKTKYKKV